MLPGAKSMMISASLRVSMQTQSIENQREVLLACAQVFKFPEGFHTTDLGELVNTAMLRFYNEERPGQLLTMKDMRQLFGVTRQAVHRWIRKGEIFPVWVKNTTRFYRKDVDRLIENQQKKKGIL
jgi:predicted DNA-binding transcriptional regulator AlpA